MSGMARRICVVRRGSSRTRRWCDTRSQTEVLSGGQTDSAPCAARASYRSGAGNGGGRSLRDQEASGSWEWWLKRESRRENMSMAQARLSSGGSRKSAMQHQHQPGRSLEVLHTYTIEGMVYGRGLALAYRARDEQLEDQVVLEMSPRGEGWPDSDYLVQYRSIVTKVMRLRHPNVIATRDFVLQGDQFFVVKQYDSGLPLDVVLHGSDRTRFDLQSRESV